MKTSMFDRNVLGIPAITSVGLHNFNCLMERISSLTWKREMINAKSKRNFNSLPVKRKWYFKIIFKYAFERLFFFFKCSFSGNLPNFSSS